jgi:hypothetical protein
MEPEEIFFTPDNEPYLGTGPLQRFDEALVSAFATCRTLAPLTRESELQQIERAVVDLVPTSISIAASIRELIRQAYLPAAKILLRPLIERTAVVDYVVNQPGGIELWCDGWDYRKRPKLEELMVSMSGRNGFDRDMIRYIVDDFNSVVHAEPAGSRKFISNDPTGRPIYSPSRTLGANLLAGEISLAAFMALTFLESNAKRAFRDRIVGFSKANLDKKKAGSGSRPG